MASCILPRKMPNASNHCLGSNRREDIPATKRRKLNSSERVYSSADMPVAARDVQPSDETTKWMPKSGICHVKKTNSTRWGNGQVAVARAVLETDVTPDNEVLLRTHHPSLSPAPSVYILTEASGKPIWVIQIGSRFQVRHTHVGNLEVHIVPWMESPNPMKYMAIKNDVLPHIIDPRRFLTALDLDYIRQMFPTAIGVRVLIARYIVVLYRNSEEMIASWSEGIPDTVGGLYVGYDVIECIPTVTQVTSGHGLSNEPHGIPRSCLGLRLKLKSGEHVITTTTHGFVKPPPKKPVSLMSDWFSKAKNALSRFRTPTHLKSIPAEVRGSRATGTTPVGKTVWSAFTNQKVGTITYTYDSPNQRRPFPSGYTHDLSLITDKELPWVTSEPGVAVIDGWASYEDALGGAPVFLCILNVYKDKYELWHGDVASRQTQQAIVEGMEYKWQGQHFSESAAILWRLQEEDWKRVAGESGGVLCVGKPTDSSAKALVFQNFETPIKPWQIRGGDRELDGGWPWTIKGGFVLPSEIRQSEVQCSEPEETKNWS